MKKAIAARLSALERRADRAAPPLAYEAKPKPSDEEMAALWALAVHTVAVSGDLAARPDEAEFGGAWLARAAFLAQALEHGWVDEAGAYVGDPHGKLAAFRAIDTSFTERFEAWGRERGV